MKAIIGVVEMTESSITFPYRDPGKAHTSHCSIEYEKLHFNFIQNNQYDYTEGLL